MSPCLRGELKIKMKLTDSNRQQLDKVETSRQWAGYGFVAAMLLGLVAFVPALFHYFTGEDFIFIQNAATGRAFYEPSQKLFYRPLPNLLWQADFALWQLNAAGYHLTNLLLHLFNALVTGLLAWKLSGKREVGWLASALFALHPIHIEAVDWLASRPDLLTTLFCLISLLCGLRFFEDEPTKIWLYLISILAFAAGLLSKEAAASLPLALFGLILIRGIGNRSWKRLVLWLLPYLGVGLLYGLARYSALGGIGGYNSAGRDLFYIIWNLTGGLWLPLLFPLNIESAGMIGTLALAALLLLIYAMLAWRFFANRTRIGTKIPWLAALLLLYACVLPALNTAPVDTNMAQSRILYLPSVGFCLLAALFIHQAIHHGDTENSRNKLASRNWQFKIQNWSNLVLLLALSGWLVIALQVNLAPWQQAGEMVRRTFSLLAPYKLPFADGDTLYFEGVPDNYRGAYGWRNGLEPAASLLTGRKVGGFNRDPDLRVDYRLGRLWFLRYSYEPERSDLSLEAIYNAAPEQSLPLSASAIANWNFAACDNQYNLGWDWKPGVGQMQCFKGKGLQFNTLGQKTGLSGRSPAFPLPQTETLYLDLTSYVDFDFEQPQVLAEARLLDAESGQDLGGFQFDLAADGRTHTYRLYLLPSSPAKSAVIILKANKVRSNILWQTIAISPK